MKQFRIQLSLATQAEDQAGAFQNISDFLGAVAAGKAEWKDTGVTVYEVPEPEPSADCVVYVDGAPSTLPRGTAVRAGVLRQASAKKGEKLYRVTETNDGKYPELADDDLVEVADDLYFFTANASERIATPDAQAILT